MTQKQIQLNLEEMRKMKVYVGTPMYGGMCHGMYTKSLMDTVALGMQYGVPIQIYYLFNESLITRARNYVVANFLKSDATHLLFIDSDISWKALDLMYMLHVATERPDIQILTALYPKKTIAWEKILIGAKSGKYDDDPRGLEKLAGDMVFNPDPIAYPDGRAPIFEPVKIKEAGTGFMLIHRDVFTKYADAYPEYLYTPDHLREGEFQRGEKIMAYFDCIINEQNRYLSEDYMFCQNCTKIGINIWTLPHIELMHTGSYVFQGNLVNMAQLDIHPTIQPEYSDKLAQKAAEKAEKNNS